jgi:cyanophycinase-like exopeptidase
VKRSLLFLTVLLTLAVTVQHTTAAPSCSVTVYPRYGQYIPTPRLHGPGLLLGGGGALQAPNASLSWLHLRLLGDLTARGGNVLVLRGADTNIYDKPFYHYGNFASVQTVLIPPCASRAQVDAIAPLVDKADAVYFSGGDAAQYVAWKGSALIAAVQRVYARGGVVGGGSAGLAIQGAIVYDGVRAARLGEETTTSNAVKDPMERSISFTTGLFAWPPLAETITDTRFAARDRFGRTVVFLARILHDHHLVRSAVVYALGVDQASAVGVGPDGIARVFNARDGLGAYLIRANTFPYLRRGVPIRYTVTVSHIGNNGETFDLLRKQSSEPWYTVTVDGSKAGPYSRNPYRP